MGIVVRQSIKGSLITYVGAFIGFLTTFFVLTKYFTTEEVGLTRVLVDAALLLSGLAQMGTTSSAIRFYPSFKDAEHKDHGFFGWTVLVPFVGFVIFLILFFVFKDWMIAVFSKKSPLFADYLYFVIPLAFCLLYISVFETNSNLLMRIVVPRFIREVGIRLMVLVAYLLYVFRVVSLHDMVVLICVSYFVAATLNVFYLFRLKKVSMKIDRKYITEALRRDFLLYTLFLSTAALAGKITPLLNSFFITGKMGLAFTGVYTIALYLADMVEMPYRSLGAISRPQISQLMSDSDFRGTDALCKKVSFHQFMIGLLVFFVIWINIDLFFSLIGDGKEYAAGKWVFFILAMVRLCDSSLSVGGTVLSYSKHYHMWLFFTVLLTVSSIVLNIKFIPIWGMEGAALASLTAYLVFYVLELAYVKIKVGVTPLSLGHLKVLILMASFFVLDAVLQRYVSGSIVQMFGNRLVGSLTEAVVRTGLLCSVLSVIVYKSKFSVEVNRVFDRFLNRKSK